MEFLNMVPAVKGLFVVYTDKEKTCSKGYVAKICLLLYAITVLRSGGKTNPLVTFSVLGIKAWWKV